jgi:hypothetical protein
MLRYKVIGSSLLIIALAGAANGQLLNGDPNFPLINELRWQSTMNEVQRLCERHRIAMSTTDSAIVVTQPVLGFAARTELQFDQTAKTLKLVQAKFNEPSKALADSITSYFTRTLGRGPIRTAKEKSLLIITIRMEMALWKSPTGLVNLVTAMRGESLFDASLVFFPPTGQQNAGEAK